MAVYDQTWKEAMNQWFEPFVAFFFPHVHRDIDWSRGWKSLDKVFQQIVREAEQSDKRADKLVKVWLRDGSDVWLFIHIEIQSQRETDFVCILGKLSAWPSWAMAMPTGGRQRSATGVGDAF